MSDPALLAGEAVHRSEFSRVRVGIFPHAQEPRAEQSHRLDVRGVQRLPTLRPPRLARAGSLVNENDLHPGSGDAMAMGLDDSRRTAIHNLQHIAPPDWVAEACVHRLPRFSMDDSFDEIGAVTGRLVFPDPDDGPPVSLKRCVDSTVPKDVPLKLRGPVIKVSFGLSTVDRTPVPPAPVHKHSDAHTREHDIRAHAYSSGDNGAVHPVPQATTMELLPQCQLGPGVTTSAPTHRRRDSGR